MFRIFGPRTICFLLRKPRPYAALFINRKSEPRITRINADNFGSGRGALTYKVSLFHKI